jgi:DNA-binding NarL/FixJ family response regulator
MAVVVIVGDDLAVEDWITLVSDGIAGVVQRDSPAEELVNAVRAAAAGDGYISPALSGGLLQLIRTRLPQPRVPLKPRPALTVRESEVFELLCQGKANKEIALILGLGEKTVKFHVSNVLAKSQVRTRGQLIASSRSAVPEFA